MVKKANVTVVIHTHNEEAHLTSCIQSARLLTHNIVVIDMESTDNTVAIAKSLGATVHTFPFSEYVEPAREFGIQSVHSEWVFILDADERITKPLAKEIHATITTTPYTHFWVYRKNMFAGKQWLRHGGWWPDKQIRLLKKDALLKWPKQIHSTPHFKGEAGELKEPFEHHFHGNIEGMVQKTSVYEDIEAQLLAKAGRASSTAIFFRKFLGELTRRLLKNKGYKDGVTGVFEGVYQAFSKTITYLLLYEKTR